MHVHLPKPVHGWRGFFGEVGIIMLGVLLALGAEEIVQSVHRNQEVGEARESLNGQLADTAFSSLERIKESDCIDRQLDRYDRLIEQNSLNANFTINGHIRGWDTTAWESAVASGTVANMNIRERNLYANLFGMTRTIKELNQQEFATVIRVRTIDRHPRITDTTRDRIAQDLATLRGNNRVVTAIARQWLETAAPLKLKLGSENREALAHVETCPLAGQAIGAVR